MKQFFSIVTYIIWGGNVISKQIKRLNILKLIQIFRPLNPNTKLEWPVTQNPTVERERADHPTLRYSTIWAKERSSCPCPIMYTNPKISLHSLYKANSPLPPCCLFFQTKINSFFPASLNLFFLFLVRKDPWIVKCENNGDGTMFSGPTAIM